MMFYGRSPDGVHESEGGAWRFRLERNRRFLEWLGHTEIWVFLVCVRFLDEHEFVDENPGIRKQSHFLHDSLEEDLRI